LLLLHAYLRFKHSASAGAGEVKNETRENGPNRASFQGPSAISYCCGGAGGMTGSG
jgi:hypothetical protein